MSGVAKGDRLVLVSRGFAGEDDNWSLVTVTAVTPATDPATGAINTHLRFAKGGWGPATSAGGAAVPTAPNGLKATGYRLLRPAATAAIIGPHLPHTPARETPLENSDSETPEVQRVHLSAAVRAISPGDLVLFDLGAGKAAALAFVTGTSEALWAIPFPGTQDPDDSAASPAASATSKPPDIVIAHTVLHIATADSQVLLDVQEANALDSVAVRYGFTDVGTIIGVPPATLQSLGGKVAAAYTPPSGGTTAFLQDATGAGVLVKVTDAGSGDVIVAGPRHPAVGDPLSKPLAVPLQLLLNLVPVSRGTTVTERGARQRERGTRQPVLHARQIAAHLSLRQRSGIESTLTVTVDHIEWHEVPSFYNQAAAARVFVVTRSPDQTVTTVTFGDGVNGARLPSGTGNVVATLPLRFRGRQPACRAA